jgi:UDP-N-acetylglucosamine 2-epimerase (non-hydrolysing)
MLIDIIAGARPNFMKIAPIIDAIKVKQRKNKTLQYRLIHTGQHYDKNMSDSFFEQLGIPQPDENLGVGSGTQAEQTAGIMIGYEKLIFKKKPDLCIVVGDVTSTMACAISAKKLGVKVAHVEAGIRSFDLTMPEEINRMVTDSITDYYFTTSAIANSNLKKSGISKEKILFVGNTMIDTLLKQMPRFIQPPFWESIGLKEKEYLVMTLHRPANVDDADNLKALLTAIKNSSNNLPIIFPVHPRTLKNINALDLNFTNLYKVEPMSYLEFNFLVQYAKGVITDSGGITEETTVMGVPCITLRDNTERPETISLGTNELIGTNPNAIPPALEKLLNGNWKKGGIPPKWDGKTGKRIIDLILNLH